MRKSIVLLCFMLSASIVFGDDLKKYLGEGTVVIEGKINDYPDFQDEGMIQIVVENYIKQNTEDVPIKKDGTFKAEIPITDIQNVFFTIKGVFIEFFSFKNDTVKITFQYDKPVETLHLSGTSKNRNLDLELCLALSKYRASNHQNGIIGMMHDPSFTDSARAEKLNQFYKDQIEIIRAFQEKNGDTDFTEKIIKDTYFQTCNLAVRGLKRLLLPAIKKDIDYQNRYSDYSDYNTLNQNVFRTSSIYRDYLTYSLFLNSLPPYSYMNLNLYGDDDEAENKISTLKREYYYALYQLNNAPSIRDWYITDRALGNIPESEPDDIRSFLDDFKTICQNKTYIATLENLYSNILNLYAASAPDFTLKNEKGELVSLSDFKGRIVYLDFWNSFCGPCIGQFLNYDKKFHEKYKDSDIVHIYVCFSNDENRWKEDLKKYDLQGINLIAEEKKDNPIYKNYGFHAYPHYVLIGKDGRVYKNNCESPSGFLNQDGNLLDELINNGL